jgi:hypothetical protein
LSENIVDLLVGQTLPQVGYGVVELGPGNEAVAVLVKDEEGVSDRLLDEVELLAGDVNLSGSVESLKL